MNNKPSIGLDNGSAPNRRQAIIWTNADPIQWRIYAALGEMSEWKLNQAISRFIHIVDWAFGSSAEENIRIFVCTPVWNWTTATGSSCTNTDSP